jgi:hypothetical protein
VDDRWCSRNRHHYEQRHRLPFDRIAYRLEHAVMDEREQLELAGKNAAVVGGNSCPF